MARATNKLTDLEIRRRKEPGWLSDGDCLFCRVSPPEHGGGKRWVLRYTFAGRKREMGLGDASVVPLAEARRTRGECMALVRAGKDPIEERKGNKRAEQAERIARENRKTFRHAAESEMKRRETGWRKHGPASPTRRTSAATWRKSLLTDCAAFLDKPVEEISQADVIAVLQPFWDRGALVSARRLRERIKAVLDHAIALEWRASVNPVASEKFAKLEPVQPFDDDEHDGHHPSLPYAEMPDLICKLRRADTMSALTLEMLALTGCRSAEVRGALWSEVDFDAAVWTVPVPRLKVKASNKKRHKPQPHRVPLSTPALALFKRLFQRRIGDFVFWGETPKRPISNMSCWALLRRLGGGSVHGLRASFRSWCDDTGVAYHVADKALAHAGGPLDKAYRRTDMLDQRRVLMEEWARFLEGESESAKVVPLKRRVRR
jgi:integrase